MPRNKCTFLSIPVNRRRFIKYIGSTLAAISSANIFTNCKRFQQKPQNILLILTDQQHIDTIAAAGCPYVETPNMDKLIKSGTSFRNSYASNAVCSPTRSSILTGRMSSETGVYKNGIPIRESIPNIGQWFSLHTKYETVYAGKWHLPSAYQKNIHGFRVLNTGISGNGYYCDETVANACSGYLQNLGNDQNFFMIASFQQPHDICEWFRLNMYVPDDPFYSSLLSELPPLPDNFAINPNEPETMSRERLSSAHIAPIEGEWTEVHWRYYLWSYYRHIEQLDAEVGNIIQTLEDYGYIDNTLIVFTSDHGEGLAKHQWIAKDSLMDESINVPLIFSWPNHIQDNYIDKETLVSSVDIFPTLCDYAGIATPVKMRGKSLRPCLEGKPFQGHEYIVTELNNNKGRMVRTKRYKYNNYYQDAVDQLFDMAEDPGETKNISQVPAFASIVKQHQKLLKDWEKNLDIASNVPHPDYWKIDKTFNL